VSIKKRPDGTWIVNIQPGGRTGKQVKRVFQTQAEAKQFKIWVLSNHARDSEWKPQAKDTRKLSELISTWYTHHGSMLRAGKDTYARLKAIAVAVGDPVATQFNADLFAEYRSDRIAAGVSPNTMNREHAYLRSVFNELIRLKHWQRENPLKQIRQVKIQERELTYLSLPDVAKLISELRLSRNPHALPIAKVCLATGARWGEAQTLSVTQIRDGVIQYANETKSKKARAVPINEDLELELKKHHKQHGKSERIFGYAYSAFLEALDRTAIALPKGQAAHVLRHTFASHFMMQGGNILVLQRTLGHSDLKMTMRYAHLAPDHLAEVRSKNPLLHVKELF
jgi:integrase